MVLFYLFWPSEIRVNSRHLWVTPVGQVKLRPGTLEPMRVLGIETSCDETAAAVVEINNKSECRLLSNVVASSMDLHVQYGGVVPEIAARSHIEAILPVVDQALRDAQADCIPNTSPLIQPGIERQKGMGGHLVNTPDPWAQIDAIAVTYGPGLGGSLLIGVLTARTFAIARDKPLYAINHVEGHVYANFITQTVPSLSSSYHLRSTPPAFPMLALIVSGGHSQLVLFRNHFDYTLLGQTHDDAIGEAFDKVAKILGLPYPGGPNVERLASKGNPRAFHLPKAKLSGKYDFSFSGIKTAVLRLAQEQIGEDFNFPSTKLSERLSEAQKTDIAASFLRVAVETIVDKTILAYEEFNPISIVIAGGVAANAELRIQLSKRLPCPIEYPDLRLCTDNAAMIATLGCFSAYTGQPPTNPLTLDIAPNLSM